MKKQKIMKDEYDKLLLVNSESTKRTSHIQQDVNCLDKN